MSKLAQSIRTYKNYPLVAFVVLALAGGWALKTSASHTTDEIRNDNIAACNAGKKVSALQAKGWKAAHDARQATADNKTLEQSERNSARKTAVIYQELVDKLTQRSHRDCEKEFGT